MRVSRFSKRDSYLLACLFIAALFLSACTYACTLPPQPDKRYVTPDGSGSRSGESWADAMGNDEFAAELRARGGQSGETEYLLSEGLYRPTADDDRTKSFVLTDGVKLYGGWAREGDIWSRDTVKHQTVFTGDLASNDVFIIRAGYKDNTGNDNSLHVITAEGVGGGSKEAVLDGITVTGGYGRDGEGAGMRIVGCGGNLTISDCIFLNNATPGSRCGVAMYVKDSASLTVDGCKFEGNHAYASLGAGIYNDNSSYTIKNTLFTNNSVELTSGGGGIYNCNNSSGEILNCVFRENYIDIGTGGAGIYNVESSPLIKGCSFENNQVTGGTAIGSGERGGKGGAIYNEGSSPTIVECNFTGNAAASEYACGGAIYNTSYKAKPSLPVIEASTFEGNTVTADGSSAIAYGGAIFNMTDCSAKIASCEFIGNSARNGEGNTKAVSGGGIFNWSNSAEITACTFYGNSAKYGGGVYNYHSTLALSNCSFIENNVFGYGGGIYNNNAAPVVVNCTLSKNIAQYGPGIFNATSSCPILINTILWGDIDTSERSKEIYDNDHSEGYNSTLINCVVPANSCTPSTLTNDAITEDPGLGSLGDNGGPVRTVPISSEGSAYNSGLAPGVYDGYEVPSVDARGVRRRTSDIGAYAVGEYILEKTVASLDVAAGETFNVSQDTILTVSGGMSVAEGGKIVISGVKPRLVVNGAATGVFTLELPTEREINEVLSVGDGSRVTITAGSMEYEYADDIKRLVPVPKVVTAAPEALSLTVGEASAVSIDVSPAESYGTPSYSVDDISIASISNNIVAALHPGTAKVKAEWRYKTNGEEKSLPTAGIAVTVRAAQGRAEVTEAARTDGNGSGVITIGTNTTEDFAIYDALRALYDEARLPEGITVGAKPITALSRDIELSSRDIFSDEAIERAIGEYWNLGAASAEKVCLVSVENTVGMEGKSVFAKIWRLLASFFGHGTGEYDGSEYLPVQANFTIAPSDIASLPTSVKEGLTADNLLERIDLFVLVRSGDTAEPAARSLNDVIGGGPEKYISVSGGVESGFEIKTRVVVFDQYGGVKDGAGAKWVQALGITSGDETREDNYFIVQDGRADREYTLCMAFAIREANSARLKLTIDGDLAESSRGWMLAASGGTETAYVGDAEVSLSEDIYTITLPEHPGYYLAVSADGAAALSPLSKDLKWGKAWEISAAYSIKPILNAEITVKSGTTDLEITGPSSVPFCELSAAPTPSDAAVKTVKWSTSDSSIVELDQNGKVTAVSGGAQGRSEAVVTAEITGIDGSVVSASKSVTVTAAYVIGDGESYTVDEDTALYSLALKGTGKINIADGARLTVKSGFTAESSSSLILNGGGALYIGGSASGAPRLTANDVSAVNITVGGANSLSFDEAIINGKTNVIIRPDGKGGYELKENVPVPAGEMIVTPDRANIITGGSQQLVAEIYPEDSTEREVTWTSSNQEIAAVDANGLVTADARNTGEAVITARTGNLTDTVKITVTARPAAAENIVLSAGSVNIYAGQEATVTAAVVPTTVADKEVSWTVADGSGTVSKVSSSGGMITIRGERVGTAVIEASKDGISAQCQIHVSATPPSVVPVSGITLSNQKLSVGISTTVTLSVQTVPADATGNLEWSLEDSAAGVLVTKPDGSVSFTAGTEAKSTDITAIFTAPDGKTVKTACNINIEDHSKPAKAIFKENDRPAENVLAVNTARSTTASEDITSETVKGQLVTDDKGMSKLSEPALAAALAAEKETVAVENIAPLPIVTARAPSAPGAELPAVILAIDISGGNMPYGSKKVDDLRYVKMNKEGCYEILGRVDSTSELKDGKWLIKELNEEGDILAGDAELDRGKSYQVEIAVLDNGLYDHNDEIGKITDPGALVTQTAAPAPPATKNGSGGCSAGFTWLLVFAALPVLLRRKK